MKVMLSTVLVAACGAVVGAVSVGRAHAGQPGFKGDETSILSAALVQHGSAVAVRTATTTQLLDPGRGDTALAGYEQPLISPDGEAAVWLEDLGPPISDANYPEPTSAWLFAHGRVLTSMGCDFGGKPFSFRFENGGKSVVLVCSFPHGPPSTHEVAFLTSDGRCLSVTFSDSGKRQVCGTDRFH